MAGSDEWTLGGKFSNREISMYNNYMSGLVFPSCSVCFSMSPGHSECIHHSLMCKNVCVPCRFMREMPYGYDILLENVLDPSHVPFSHHGVIGDRNKVMPSRMHTVESIQESGFTMGITTIKNGTNRAQQGSGKTSNMTFASPALVK